MERYSEKKFDVVVAGGGVSGAAAAIAAAREGADTLLLEQEGYLGGSLTGCGVGPMMTFFAGEKQVIAGVMQEIVDELVRRGCSRGHVRDTTQYVSYNTPFSAEGLKLVLDEMTADAGCRVLFHTAVGGAERSGKTLKSLTVCNKDGLNPVTGSVFIDATGDADVAALAGASFTKGRPSDGAAQPMTMNMKYCGVDSEALRAYVLAHPEEFEQLRDHGDLVRSGEPLAVVGFDRTFRRAKAGGEVEIPREDLQLFETDRPGEYIVNTTRILDHDGTSAESLSDAERVGRRQCAQLDAFLRGHVPGFEKAILEFTGPSVGVRSSRQFSGCVTLTAEDILSRRRFSSVIAHSGYPIDIHNPKGEGTDSTFLSEPGAYYSIPYEILFCDEIDNLLVAGRCVSASFEAQAAIRTAPTSGAMGQACGIAAAMATRDGCSVGQVNVSELQRELRFRGAFLDL